MLIDIDDGGYQLRKKNDKWQVLIPNGVQGHHAISRL